LHIEIAFLQIAQDPQHQHSQGGFSRADRPNIIQDILEGYDEQQHYNDRVQEQKEKFVKIDLGLDCRTFAAVVARFYFLQIRIWIWISRVFDDLVDIVTNKIKCKLNLRQL
jgi:hypothetical protein